MEFFFSIAGPYVASRHHMLPATGRLPEVVRLIRRELYFIIHAPKAARGRHARRHRSLSVV